MTSKDELREAIKAILNRNAGRIQERLEYDVDQILNLLEGEKQKQGYDPNMLGSWIFIGDNARLKNLDDLYWSYVWEYVKDYDRSYDNLEYLKNNMKYASPTKVGIYAILARADQRAKERLATLNKEPNKGEEI